MGANLDPTMSPELTDAQWERLCAFGTPVEVKAGDYLFRSGDAAYELALIETAEVEIVRDSLWWVEEAVITRMGPRTFAGELGVLNEQNAFLSARVIRPGRVRRIPHAELRRLMAEDDELCDLILHALWARRESLRDGPAALTLKLVGARSSRDFLALRRFAERFGLAHTAVEIDPSAPPASAHRLDPDDLPVAFIQGEPIVRATPGMVAERLGLSYQAHADEIVDLVVVGAGPLGSRRRSTGRPRASAPCCWMPSPRVVRRRPRRASRTSWGSRSASPAGT